MYGVSPDVHGITNDIVLTEKTNTDLNSIFQLVHNKYPEADIASIVAWSPINYGIVDGFDGMYLFPDELTDRSLSNETIVEKVKEYIDVSDPKLLFVHFDEVDHAGHASGWGSEEYYAALSNTIKDISTIHDYLAEKNYLKESLFIVTADHGGKDSEHGGDSDEEMRAVFAISGKGLNNREKIGEMQIIDISSIVCHALGVEKDSRMQGKLPENIFED